MPEQETLERARADKREGKSPSTQAGEFVREEIHNLRKGIHGARSAKQVIAIGLSKARRAGVKLPLPRKGSVPEQTRRQARREMERGRHQVDKKPSRRRSRAVLQALRREDKSAASTTALSRHARQIARQKTAAERSAAAKKAARTRRKINS